MLPHPQGSVECVRFSAFNISQNFQDSTKGRNEVTGKQWIEMVNKIAYRAYVVDGSDRDV